MCAVYGNTFISKPTVKEWYWTGSALVMTALNCVILYLLALIHLFVQQLVADYRFVMHTARRSSVTDCIHYKNHE
jgi:hypothetical protein